MQQEGRTREHGWATRFLPILTWAPAYDRRWLRADVIAGITVATLVIPKALGYAGIANVPLEHGLYAAALGAIVYAIFGTARQIATGPSSSLAAVAGSALALSNIADPADQVAFIATVAVVVGILFVLIALFQLGWISQFVSRAVIVGFLSGAALDVTIGELKRLTGTTAKGDNSWQEFWSWLGGLDAIHGTTLLVGGTALAALVVLRIFARGLPGTLVVVAAGLILSPLLDLGDRGVALVGDVPRGVPTPVLPDVGLALDHFVAVGAASFAIVMIGFSQSAGYARMFATRHGYRIDINQESLAQGAANIGSGLFQGIPVSTSLSASSLNDRAGAKSQVASLVTGVITVVGMLTFATLISSLPTPVLGAIIIEAVIFGMLDIRELRRLFRIQRADFWIAIAALTGVLLSGVLTGILIGVVLSVGWLIRTVTSPAMPQLGRAPGTQVFQELDTYPDGEQYPGILIVRLEGSLFFATADALGDRLRELVLTSPTPIWGAVLDCQSITFSDSQGSAQLKELIGLANVRGIDVRLARVKPNVFALLERDGVVQQLGADHFSANVYAAVESLLATREVVH